MCWWSIGGAAPNSMIQGRYVVDDAGRGVQWLERFDGLLTDGRASRRSDGASLFDPATLSWSPAGSPATTRNQFWTLTALPDGVLCGGRTRQRRDRHRRRRALRSLDEQIPADRPNGIRARPADRGRHGRWARAGHGFLGRWNHDGRDLRPADGSFTVVDEPAAPDITTSVLLDDGRLLIISLGRAQAQLFDPAPDQ